MTHELPSVTWLNLDAKTIRRPLSGTAKGKPQVLLNYARVSREAWRLKALIDNRGHPITSDFLAARPEPSGGWSLLTLWGLFNSPIANAFAYCHSSKRHVLAGSMRQMPIPTLDESALDQLQQLVAGYLEEVRAISVPVPKNRPDIERRDADQMNLSFAGAFQESDRVAEERLRILHWRIDAEVLRLYNLPASLERKVLDLFRGIRRRGVPFEQAEYFPKGFSELERLSDLLSVTADWPKTNRRRAKLIDLEELGQLTPEQAIELENLQRLADARVSLLKPRQAEAIDQQIEKLKRQALWTE
jgi:hypothetical protein